LLVARVLRRSYEIFTKLLARRLAFKVIFVAIYLPNYLVASHRELHESRLRILVLVSLAIFAPFASWAQTQPVELKLQVSAPFHFVAYGDTRFTDPKNIEASNAPVRRELVEAIAGTHPAFISIGGDIVYNGYDVNDWKTWDAETALWRQLKIPVYPALGNHEFHGDQKVALANYFQRFPDLEGSRYYSVRVANTIMFVLDSSLEEAAGPQGQWLTGKLDNIPEDIDFVLIVLHHPPYTSSSDEKAFGGGHSVRHPEHALAMLLEERQPRTRARFIVFAGHVHNYERHEHGGVTYFVTGGGAAHAYPIERAPDDLFQDKNVNYHYLLAEVNRGTMTITMNRLELNDGKATWTKPDSTTIAVPSAAAASAAISH
jgi:Icc-related predicted phosphoesterase